MADFDENPRWTFGGVRIRDGCHVGLAGHIRSNELRAGSSSSDRFHSDPPRLPALSPTRATCWRPTLRPTLPIQPFKVNQWSRGSSHGGRFVRPELMQAPIEQRLWARLVVAADLRSTPSASVGRSRSRQRLLLGALLLRAA